MKDKSYLAINLNDFHTNQNGKPETTTQIRFLLAKSLDDAKKFIHELEPRTAWFVLPKEYCDKNIVCAER